MMPNDPGYCLFRHVFSAATCARPTASSPERRTSGGAIVVGREGSASSDGCQLCRSEMSVMSAMCVRDVSDVHSVCMYVFMYMLGAQ